MNELVQFFLGKLSLDYLPKDPVTIGAAVGMPLTVLGIVALITYLKRWTWLWEHWITSVDAKKIGVMYIIVAMIMLIRGVADAGMLRLQTALAQTGIEPFSTDTFQQ